MKKIKPQVTARKKSSRISRVANEIFLMSVLLIAAFFSPFWGFMGLKIDLFKLTAFIIFLGSTPRSLFWAIAITPILDIQQSLPYGYHALEVFVAWGLLWLTRYFFEERTFWVHWGTFSLFISLINFVRFEYYLSLDFILIPSKFLFEAILHILIYPMVVLLFSKFLKGYLGRSYA